MNINGEQPLNSKPQTDIENQVESGQNSLFENTPNKYEKSQNDINLDKKDEKTSNFDEKEQKNLNLDNAQDQNLENSDSDNLDNGSPYGKFKDANSLLSAYNSLQAEFTKKCQRLNEIEKQFNLSKQSEIDIKVKQVDAKSVSATTRVYDDEFQSKVAEFVSAHPLAKTYATEISEEMINDNSMTIERAYDKILAKHHVEPSELVSDEKFLNDYIYSNRQIRDRVLQEFFEGIQSNPVPKLIGLDRGEISVSKPLTPTSIDDAGKLALDLLKG